MRTTLKHTKRPKLLLLARGIVTLAAIAVLLGCAPTSLQTYKVMDYAAVPKMTYTVYSYSFGVGDRLRVALLRNPESGAEILPYSEGIVATTGTFEDAMAFMRGGAYSEIDVNSVVYKGKTIGYLLTYIDRGVITDPVYLEAHLFEHGEKIYFSVEVKNYYGDRDRMQRTPR
jgi:hypothetical protein